MSKTIFGFDLDLTELSECSLEPYIRPLFSSSNQYATNARYLSSSIPSLELNIIHSINGFDQIITCM